MVRWVVGKAPDEILVGKFPKGAPNSAHSLDKIAQPAVLSHEVTSREIELEVGSDLPRFKQFQKKGTVAEPQAPKRVLEEESWAIKDKDGSVKYRGRPGGVEASSWCLVREMVNAKGETEYHVNRVDQWLNFQPSISAQERAPDLETSESVMKEMKQKAKTEFSDYLKQKRRKAEENGVVLAKGAESEDDATKPSVKRKRKLLLRRRREEGEEAAESSVAFVGGNNDKEGGWEGEEAFSDDDDQLFDDEANAHVELGMEVEDDDVERDRNTPDEEEVLKDAFGSEIEKIMHEEQEKEHVAEDELDDELKKYAESDMGDDQPEVGGEDEAEAATKPPARPAKPEPPMMARKTTKEEQIRARVKGMFWRNEYKLKLKDILAQFPGLNRAAEEYQHLTRALKDLADVKDGVLHLKQQFRK